MHRPRFDLPGLSGGFVADVVRVDVETDPTGLVNLVQNPDGQLGGFGWLAPTAGTVVRGSTVPTLEFVTASSSVATYYATELMPVTTSGYVAAQWTEKGFTDLAGTAQTTGYYRARWSWYDATGTQTGSSTQSSYYQNSASTVVRTYAATAVPVGVTHARLRFDAYSNTSGANPTANRIYKFTDVRAATAATAPELQVTYTNLITNPSLETNATGWSDGTRTSGTANVGTYKLTLNKPMGVSGAATLSPSFPVTPGTKYAGSLMSRLATGSQSGTLRIRWYDSTGTEISTSSVYSRTLNTTYAKLQASGTAPTNAVTGRLSFAFIGSAAASIDAYVDAAICTATQGQMDYFDGASTDTSSDTYDWTGTAHASTSTRTTSDLSDLVPVEYIDVTGASKGISLTRDALDVGTLTVEVVDAALDPAEADLIRPGRRCRLQALDSAGVWGVIYTGRLTGAQVSYPLLNPAADGKANITVTAVDNIATLAAAERPDSVATIDELPYVLEGCGVPWNVNGNNGQVASATIRAVSDGTTAVDQCAITRDTAHGFVWVDRDGILHAWDADEIDTTPVVTLDEDTYSDVVIGFDTDACINECVVTLRSTDSTGQSVETTTTYVDSTSAAQWGRHRAEFTVLTPTNPATFAAEVLAANATPEIRISEVLLSVRDADTIDLAHLDLFDAVTLVNTEKGISEVAFITGITHTITRDKWLMVVRFASPNAVASPQVVPPLSSSRAPFVQAGTADFPNPTTITAGSGTYVDVTFPTAYTTAPVVTVSLATANGSTQRWVPRTLNRTATGFRLYIYNVGTTDTTVTSVASVAWMAYGA